MSLHLTHPQHPPPQPFQNQHFQTTPVSAESKRLTEKEKLPQLLSFLHLRALPATAENKRLITPVDSVFTRKHPRNPFIFCTYENTGGRGPRPVEIPRPLGPNTLARAAIFLGPRQRRPSIRGMIFPFAPPASPAPLRRQGSHASPLGRHGLVGRDRRDDFRCRASRSAFQPGRLADDKHHGFRLGLTQALRCPSAHSELQYRCSSKAFHREAIIP